MKTGCCECGADINLDGEYDVCSECGGFCCNEECLEYHECDPEGDL